MENEVKEMSLQTQETKPELKITNDVFHQKMNEVKMNVLKDSAAQDKKFVDKVKENLKKAAISSTELETKKADLEKQQIDLQSEEVLKNQRKNAHEIKEDKWENRAKRREFAFEGVKPIMNFVGIEHPMNLFLTYLFTLLLFVPFLVAKLWNGTVGALIFGACDSNRSKAMKGLLWTLLIIVLLAIIFVGVYLFLKWQGISIF